ncbi:MAG: DUF2520 domain-containing protein [Armatimonadetes bacterium]|nr:DUF2520 domain-containing protein [Armatimonadota bacterium]
MGKKYKIALIGAGIIGTAFGYLFKKAGYHILGISSRTFKSAKTSAYLIECPAFNNPLELVKNANLIFLAVPDKEIEVLASLLVKNNTINPGDILIHTSGALSSKVLIKAKDKGAHILSFHPLQSFASFELAIKNLAGTTFAIEGDKEVHPLALKLAKSLKGKILILTEEQKPLYHLGACFASNYLITIINLACELLREAGFAKKEALKNLLPLIKGTLNNLINLGLPKSLTGPISRGDFNIIECQKKTLKKFKPDLFELYKNLSLYTLNLAKEKGKAKEEDLKKISLILNEV